MDAAEYTVTVGRAVSFCEGPCFDSRLGAFLYGLSMFSVNRNVSVYPWWKRSTLERVVGVSTNSPSKNGYISPCRRLEEPLLLTELCLLNVAK